VPDKPPPKKISAKAILADLKSGMTDAELTAKYSVTVKALHDLFGKLIDAGLATQAYFAKRAMDQAAIPKKRETTKTCPYCGFTSHDPFVQCPQCKQDTTEWLDTVELTKILTGSFE
jgi:lipopolysaccharide biosynthesis regulator YciM